MSEELKKEAGEIRPELGSDDLEQVVGGAALLSQRAIEIPIAPVAGKEVSGWDVAVNKNS
jgi:hypothetical protein